MQIIKIALYGKNGERRDIDLEPGAVNIITGASQRGKTSLIHIVEYCLGASECMVAEGHIRQTVDWYSILLQFEDCQVFIARAAPQGTSASAASHMLVGNDVDVPDKNQLSNNTNIDSVVSYLTNKLGVPEQITEVPQGQTRSEVKISFRHSRYYLFQSQNEIANNEVLFHQQAKPHIPQNIKDTLPYFIGAAEDDRLVDTEALRTLKRERNQLLKQIDEIKSLKGDGVQKGYALLAEAADLGMYQFVNLMPNDQTLIIELTKLSRWAPSSMSNELVDDESDPLLKLENQYQELQKHKHILKLRLREAQVYSESENNFQKAAYDQASRLQSVELFKKFNGDHKTCPLCESASERQTRFDSIIKSALDDLANKLEGVNRTRPRVTGYVGQLRDEQRVINLKLRRLKSAISQIREKDHETANQDNLDIQRARLAGKASLYVESINWNEDSSDLEVKVGLLDEKIMILTKRLDPEVLKEKLEAQLNCIAEDMTQWARDLNLGYSGNRVRLDATKLTVVADTPDGPVPLAKMGSGENWMGYHLVTYLALAKWFIERSRPVGSFLFLDQPTQVYFPADQSETGDLSEIEKDEDREAVKNLYQWIFKVVESLSPKLQVIVTDHADIDEDWFQDAVRDNKWRGEHALVPKHWYEQVEE
ncbi:DUF3732 domain-containing protein [Amphritea pacifica]|nr:DUF3732 domain-containing protein [Amphritea pacifica]